MLSVFKYVFTKLNLEKVEPMLLYQICSHEYLKQKKNEWTLVIQKK